MTQDLLKATVMVPSRREGNWTQVQLSCLRDHTGAPFLAIFCLDFQHTGLLTRGPQLQQLHYPHCRDCIVIFHVMLSTEDLCLHWVKACIEYVTMSRKKNCHNLDHGSASTREHGKGFFQSQEWPCLVWKTKQATLAYESTSHWLQTVLCRDFCFF